MTRPLTFALLATMTGCTGAPAIATPLDDINAANSQVMTNMQRGMRNCYYIGQLAIIGEPYLEPIELKKAREVCFLGKDDPTIINNDPTKDKNGGEGDAKK